MNYKDEVQVRSIIFIAGENIGTDIQLDEGFDIILKKTNKQKQNNIQQNY